MPPAVQLSGPLCPGQRPGAPPAPPAQPGQRRRASWSHGSGSRSSGSGGSVGRRAPSAGGLPHLHDALWRRPVRPDGRPVLPPALALVPGVLQQVPAGGLVINGAAAGMFPAPPACHGWRAEPSRALPPALLQQAGHAAGSQAPGPTACSRRRRQRRRRGGGPRRSGGGAPRPGERAARVRPSPASPGRAAVRERGCARALLALTSTVLPTSCRLLSTGRHRAGSRLFQADGAGRAAPAVVPLHRPSLRPLPAAQARPTFSCSVLRWPAGLCLPARWAVLCPVGLRLRPALPRWRHAPHAPNRPRARLPASLRRRRSPEAAAETVLFAATAPAVEVGGCYCGTAPRVTRASKTADDPALAARLWELSAHLSQLPSDDLVS